MYSSVSWASGALIFTGVSAGCLGFVIFATSRQSLSGLRTLVGGAEPPARPSRTDRLLGKLVLFVVFLGVTTLIILLFTFARFYQAPGARNATTVSPTTGEAVDWAALCEANDAAALAALGLS